MVRKFVVWFITAALIYISPVYAFIRGGVTLPPLPSFISAWQPLPLGSGGQGTAVYNYSDGTTLLRTDNYGAWVYSASVGCTYGGKVYTAPCWNNVLTATSIPGFSIDLTFREGAVELVAAPSNSSILYMIWNAGFYVSINKGLTWVQCTNYPGTTQTANNGNASGPFIWIDPNDPTVGFVDALGHGLYKIANGTSGGATTTFTQVATVGTTTEHVGAYQQGSSTHVLVWTQGTGAFESTNASTFTAKTTGSPPSISIADPHMYADKFNQFWVWDAGGSTASAYFWNSTTWTARNTGSTGNGLNAAMAFDPTSASVGANKIASSDYRGAILISTDNGVTWTSNFTNHSVSCGATQPTWVCVANQNQGTGEYQLNGYSIAFDQSGNLTFAGGLGTWKANTPTTGNSLVWNADMVGIEQLVSTQIISPAGYAPITGMWDKGFMLNVIPGVYPTKNWDNDTSLSPIIGGWALDYASSDPTFITGWATSNISASVAPASSINGGNDWSLWSTVPSHPGAQGGAIAALDSTHWLLQPGTGNALVVTSNGGSTWNTVTISGTPTNWTSTGVSIPLAADRVTANQFCAVTGSQVFYQSTNAGTSMTATGLTSANVDGSPNSFTFKSTPLTANTFFYTAGEQGGAHPNNTHFWKITKTTNPCDTATNVNVNLKEVMAFGFGAHKPGASGTCPTIYVNAWLNGTQGFYYNTDCATTTAWAALNIPASETPWPINGSDFPKDITGDLDIYGRVYLVFAQSAGVYIDTQDACPWVGMTSIKPNDSLTGTVSLTAAHSGLTTLTGVNFYVDGLQVGTTQVGAGPYTVSWNTGSVVNGAHTLKVEGIGNGCGVGGPGNSKSMPITTH
jgi:hypothetical protein